MTAGNESAAGRTSLKLPTVAGFALTSGSFEIPQTKVTINLKPELVGQMLVLLAEAVEAGVDAGWFRLRFEDAASTVIETGSGRDYLQAFVDVAALAHSHGLLSSGEICQVHLWAEEVRAPLPLPKPVSADTQRRWDEARAVLQGWVDTLDLNARKRLLRQRSVARVACDDCHSMLAYFVPQGSFEFLVLARGDNCAFEVAHAVGEYGGYARTRCGGRKSGRFWVLHADHLREWLDLGHPDVNLRHEDKGL